MHAARVVMHRVTIHMHVKAGAIAAAEEQLKEAKALQVVRINTHRVASPCD